MDWDKLCSEAQVKPELVDMSPAISSAMAVKDEEESVSLICRLGVQCVLSLLNVFRKLYKPPGL